MNVFFLPVSAHPSAFSNIIKELLEQEDEDTLARILTTIAHAASIGGHPQEPTSRRLKGVDMCEIRSKCRHGELIRIYYFTDKDSQRMFLLNYIIKPDGSNNPSLYEGNAGKRLERDLQQSIDLALRLKMSFPSFSTLYELLPHIP